MDGDAEADLGGGRDADQGQQNGAGIGTGVEGGILEVEGGYRADGHGFDLLHREAPRSRAEALNPDTTGLEDEQSNPHA